MAIAVHFDPSTHTYWHDNVQLASVSSVVHRVTPPFDSDRVSAYVAKRDGLTKEEVLRSWEAKSKASMENGTRVHAYVESVLLSEDDPIANSLNDKAPEMHAFDKAWCQFRANLDAKLDRSEFIVACPFLGVAGRLDVLLSVKLVNQDHRSLCLFDWKTGKFERRNRFENLLPPFDDLPNCEWTRYSLQLSLYRLLLERQEKLSCIDGYLVHLGASGTYYVHKAMDLRARLVQWLTRNPYGNNDEKEQG